MAFIPFAWALSFFTVLEHRDENVKSIPQKGNVKVLPTGADLGEGRLGS